MTINEQMRGATQKSPGKTIAKCLWFVMLGCSAVMVAVASDLREARISRVLEVYQQAREAHQSAPVDPETAWKLGRACFDLAEFSTNDTQRAELAEEGIGACLAAIQADSNSAPAHYYLAMNRGQMARTMNLGALKLVHQMEDSFEKARVLNSQLDRAGPDRNLGLLYLEAPGWPVSVGSKGKARRHLSKAAELTPDFPENHLNLMEAFAKWGKDDLLRKEWEDWKKVADKAHAEFSGERWRYEWVDWNRRLDAIRKKLGIEEEPDLTVTKVVSGSAEP